MPELTLTVRGCRGSMSVAGDRYRRYGGNTTCFHAEVEPGHHLVIDCGTGLRSLQHDIDDQGPQRFTVLFTHYHWDHIQGLPGFLPLFESGNSVTFCGPRSDGRSVREILATVVRPPWWPVTLDEAAADLTFRDLGDSVMVGRVRVTHAAGNHPQGVEIYRLDGPDRSVVIATDHEAGNEEVDSGLVQLATGADVLIHDAQYTPEELSTIRKGWGHSSFESAVAAAQASGVGRLILASHDPDRSDEDVDRLRGMARTGFPNTDAAYEGMTIPL